MLKEDNIHTGSKLQLCPNMLNTYNPGLFKVGHFLDGRPLQVNLDSALINWIPYNMATYVGDRPIRPIEAHL